MKTIHLQGIGEKLAKCASEIKAGDMILWNSGYTSKVLSVELKGKSAYITTLTGDGNTYQRRYAQTRLLAVKEKLTYRDSQKSQEKFKRLCYRNDGRK